MFHSWRKGFEVDMMHTVHAVEAAMPYLEDLHAGHPSAGIVALADGIKGFDGAKWFLYLFLGVYTLYIGRTGLGVLLKLGSPAFYRKG